MKRLHLINHTHWDREWHKTFEEFRVRLVYVIDQLLDLMETNKDFSFFTLDAQTVVLEDYLQVRPENEERLKILISEKRIFVGPWYTQPDEFLVSGESIVRNLLIGTQMAERFGHSMELGYLPDSFGQAAQIPQILTQMGLEKVIIWRGVSWKDTDDTIFLWEGLDGTKILTLHLPLGYGYNRYLPFEADEAEAHLLQTMDKISDRFPGNDLLLLSGSDHAAPHPLMTQLLTEINDKWAAENKDVRVEFSHPEKVFSAIASVSEEYDLLKGELRNPHDMRIHAGITSSRMDIKSRNKLAEVKLERIIEPIKAFEYVLANKYENRYLFGGRDANGSINQAWKYLLQNHSHDSICSCCTDGVHRDILSRFDKIDQISKALIRMNMKYMEANIDLSQLTGKPILLYNTLPYKRTDLVTLHVHTESGEFQLVDPSGAEIPYEVISERDFDLASLSINMAMKGSRVWVKESVINVSASILPAGGYLVLQAVEGNKSTIQPSSHLQVLHNGMENEFLRVVINDNGSLSITEKESGKTTSDLLVFEDDGDEGDEYNYSPPNVDQVISTKDSKASIQLIHEGKLEVVYQIEHQLELPAYLVTDKKERSSEKLPCTIRSFVSLKEGMKRMDVETTIDNQSENHRIRALFPTGIVSAHSLAEDHFGVIQRPNQIQFPNNWEEEGYNEKPLPIYPQQSFVDLNDGNSGLAIINKGLPEYEILDDTTIALTLLRSVGHVGKPGLNIRPGRVSGIELSAPAAQMKGSYTFSYAIYPHQGNYDEAGVVAEAHQFISSVYSEQLMEPSTEGELPLSQSFITLNTKNIVLSALKKAEKEDALIVRLYNSGTTVITDGKINLDVDKVYVTNLREEENFEQLELQGNEFILPMLNPAQMVTLKIYQ